MRGPSIRALALVLALAAVGCSSQNSLERLAEPRVGMRQVGEASWYGTEFHGRKTASGTVYDMDAVSAAHRDLPFGTWVLVHNLDNGRRLEVEITDRGPFVADRILDLSRGAARELGMLSAGVADIELRVLRLPDLSGGRFLVQVGAYRDRDNALATLQRLGADVPALAIYTDGPWHRVQVRGLSSRRQARGVRRQLRKLGVEALVRERGAL